MKSINVLDIMIQINKEKPRSAWNQGVKLYAMEILSKIREEGHECLTFDENGKLRLQSWTIYSLSKGFDHWVDMSKGCTFLVYDRDIAIRLCTGSELQKTKWGERNPSKRETWIECQGRALYQARNLICDKIKEMVTE